NERPFMNHKSYIFLSKKPEGRRMANSAFSGLFRRSIVPPETLNAGFINDFLDKVHQFERIMLDSGLVQLNRLNDDQLAGDETKVGLIERYCFLLNETEKASIRDIHLKDEIRIGHNHVQLFSLSDVERLPSLCGSRINYDKYST